MTDPQVPATRTSIPGLPEDWDRQATERLVSTVDQVRVKTSGPAIGVARLAVYGILAALLGLIAFVLFLIGIVRLLDNVLPATVWLTYVILGSLFTLIGLFLWSKRPKRAAS